MPHFLQTVTPDWIHEQMKKYCVAQKDIAVALNADKGNVSNWLSGTTSMSKVTRAAFYYYFEAKKRGM